MTLTLPYPDVSSDELRDILAGRSHRLPRREALRRIAVSHFDDREAVLQSVLENRDEQPLDRGVAAAGLAARGTDSALRALVRAASDAEPGVLAGAMQILARSGGRPEQRILEDIAARAPGRGAEHARFAAALIAYRLRLDTPGLDDRQPETLALEEPGRMALDVERPSPADAERCRRSLDAERLPFSLSSDSAVQLRCRARTMIVTMDPAFLTAGGVETLSRAKALVALVATRIEDGVHYSASHVVLADPVRGARIRFSICRASGSLALTGEATVAESVAFSLRTVKRPGAVAVDIAGHFGPGGLLITRARANGRVHGTVTPQRAYFKPRQLA